MKIKNILLEESLSYEISGKTMQERQEEIISFDILSEYCALIGEKIKYTEKIWDMVVSPGKTFADYLYSASGGEDHDYITMLQEMIGKKRIIELSDDEQENVQEKIECSIGAYLEAAWNLKTYLCLRQDFLRTMNALEYGKFMKSCFPNSIFADGCDNELRNIVSFEKHRDEITDCLAFLDGHALEYFKQNLVPEDALKRLQAEFGRSCSMDPKHKGCLQFEFEYQENDKVKRKKIECQPHFKLIRDDSDLRIYFYWKDSQVGDGNKILIGRIGRHPYKK